MQALPIPAAAAAVWTARTSFMQHSRHRHNSVTQPVDTVPLTNYAAGRVDVYKFSSLHDKKFNSPDILFEGSRMSRSAITFCVLQGILTLLLMLSW